MNEAKWRFNFVWNYIFPQIKTSHAQLMKAKSDSHFQLASYLPQQIKAAITHPSSPSPASPGQGLLNIKNFRKSLVVSQSFSDIFSSALLLSSIFKIFSSISNSFSAGFTSFNLTFHKKRVVISNKSAWLVLLADLSWVTRFKIEEIFSRWQIWNSVSVLQKLLKAGH